MRKTILFIFLILALLPSIALAQVSNTSNASAGQFTTGTDAFMGVSRWQSISKDLVFVGLNTGVLDAGYGVNLSKGLYLGLYYYGYAFDTDPGTLVTTVNSTLLLDNNIPIGEQVGTYVGMDGDFQTWLSNDFSALLGFGAMGVKLSLDNHSYMRKDKFDIFVNVYDMTTAADTRLAYLESDLTGVYDQGTDYQDLTYAEDGTTVVSDDTKAYSGGQYSTSTLMGYATWGMAMPLGKMTLRPFVALGGGLRDLGTFNQSYTRFIRSIGTGFPAYGGVEEVGSAYVNDWRMNRKLLAVEPSLGVNLEMPQGASTASFDASYGLDLYLPSNSYIGLDGTSATANGYAYDYHNVDYSYNLMSSRTTDIRAYEIESVSRQQHDLNLSAKLSKKLSDKVSLSGSILVPAILVAERTSVSGGARRVTTYVDNADAANNYVDTTDKTYSRTSVARDYLSVSPRLSAGLQWAAVKDLLTFNLGANVSIPSFMSDTYAYTVPGFTSVSEYSVYADGSVLEQPNQNTMGSTRSENQEATTEWGTIGTSVRGGFNLNLGTGISLDMNCNVSTTTISASTFSLQVQIRR